MDGGRRGRFGLLAPRWQVSPRVAAHAGPVQRKLVPSNAPSWRLQRAEPLAKARNVAYHSAPVCRRMCLGHVAGALVGTTYPDRAALREAGIHRQNQAGITGLVRRSAEAVGIRARVTATLAGGRDVIVLGISTTARRRRRRRWTARQSATWPGRRDAGERSFSTGGHTRRPAAVQCDETRARGASVVSAIQRAERAARPHSGERRADAATRAVAAGARGDDLQRRHAYVGRDQSDSDGIIPDHAPVTAVFI